MVRIVTDSVACVPASLCDELGIIVLPMFINLGGKSYRDGVDLAADEVYRWMRENKELPTTSQVTIGQFEEVFDRCLHEGEAVLVITISQALSGTMRSAEAARATFPDDAPIVLFDSRTAAFAQGLIVLEAARKAAQGASLEETLQHAETIRAKTKLYGVVDTLEYLRRGGRIGRAAAMAGTLLNVKPILTIDPDGVVNALERVRGKERALRRVVEWVAGQVPSGARLHAGILQADSLEEAEQLETMLRGRFDFAECFMTTFTPVMGAHTGPGLVGVAFFSE
ncbi:MAG: DegV family protein [Firmicutes bacterium]|nr:DegV family protein [Bacillota bacterium]